MDQTLPVPLHANISFVTPHLAVGGDLSYDDELAGRQLDELVALGVTHVVDARGEWSDADVVAERAPSLRYLHHGMDDAGQRVPRSWFDEAVQWVLDAGPDAVVLTHCHMGINRGPSLGFAVLLAQGWEPVAAIDAVRRARPIANVWYAADALRWHHARTAADSSRIVAEQLALAGWRDDNPLDVVRIIRQQREAGL